MAALEVYDYEMQGIANVYAELLDLASRTPNTKLGIEEFSKRALDKFHKLGFIVAIDMSAAALINPQTDRSFSPEIEIIGRVDDPFSMKEIDHDRKRFEVLDGNAHGEKYRGEKRTNVDKGTKKGY